MPDKKRTDTPGRSYDFQLTIGELDYTNDLKKVQIVSAISSPYPVVTLDITLDSTDVILDRIFGKEPLKLKIRLIGRDIEKIPKEQVNLELMYVQSSGPMPQKPSMGTKSVPERVPYSFITVPRAAFKSMNVTVNDIFENQTPRQIIESLVGEYTDATLLYDTDGENKTKVEQLLVAPQTLYKTIRYLDDNYGLFKGASNLGYCQYDNRLYIQNLTKRINKAQTFTVYHLSTDSSKDSKEIMESADGKTFYTYEALESSNAGNTKFAALAKNIKHVIKPVNKFFAVIEQNLDDVCAKFGANFKNKKIDIDTKLDFRETFNVSSTGPGDESSTFANAKMARKIMEMATVSIGLEKNLPVLNLINVGEPVKLNTNTLEYVDLSGKYLLKSSHLIFERPTPDWTSTARIVLMRTNPTI